MVNCSLCKNNNVRVVSKIDTKSIIEKYVKLNVDVSNYFKKINYIELLECNNCFYRFYFPKNIIGDGLFYSKLQKNSWYYQSNKWEFNEIIKYIKGFSSLEVGCGDGAFLRLLNGIIPNHSIHGIDINTKEFYDSKLKIFNQSLEEFSIKDNNKYDNIISFQVLEHLTNPYEYFKKSLELLNENGRIIIAVPNYTNVQYQRIIPSISASLNLPPHHQGIWSIETMSFITQLFPLRLIKIQQETVEKDYEIFIYRKKIKDLIINYPILGPLSYFLLRPVINFVLNVLKSYLPSHSIIAIYEKK